MIQSDFHPAAKQEQLDLLAYFENLAPETAERFQGRIDHFLSLIERMPRLIQEHDHGVRIVSLNPHFGQYFIAYTILNKTVIILAIGHAKRKPFYFVDRISEAKTILGQG